MRPERLNGAPMQTSGPLRGHSSLRAISRGRNAPADGDPRPARERRNERPSRPLELIQGQPPRLDRVRPAAAVAHRPDPGPRRRRLCHRSAAAAGAGLRRLGASGSGGWCRADAPGGERRPGPVDPGSLPLPTGALPGHRNGPLGRLGAPLPVRVLPASRPALWGRREAGRTGRAAEAVERDVGPVGAGDAQPGERNRKPRLRGRIAEGNERDDRGSPGRG